MVDRKRRAFLFRLPYGVFINVRHDAAYAPKGWRLWDTKIWSGLGVSLHWVNQNNRRIHLERQK